MKKYHAALLLAGEDREYVDRVAFAQNGFGFTMLGISLYHLSNLIPF